jgi:hypothetical protein
MCFHPPKISRLWVQSTQHLTGWAAPLYP